MNKGNANDNHGVIPVDAINQAELLLEFAAQRGLTVAEKVVTDIVEAKHVAATPDKWSNKVDTSFWLAYDSLAKAVQPVSVHSLRALGKIYEGGLPFLRKLLKSPKVSDADKSVNYYRRLTVIFITMLLMFQILFSYGTAVVSELNHLPDKIAQVEVDKQKLLAEIKKTPGKETTAAANPELGALSGKKESLERKYRASFKILEKWLAIIGLGMRASTPEASKPVEGPEKHDKEAMGQIIMLQDSTFILLVMQSYLLPLLYGFVGACAHILRTLSTEIRNVTYTRESKVLYLARFLLGGLSGLAIGWFISPSTDASLKTISPFALAFVAGYGVELLFSVMDKIIATFSNESRRKQPETNA